MNIISSLMGSRNNIHSCLVCGYQITCNEGMSAHEFECFIKAPHLVPDHQWPEFLDLYTKRNDK